MKRTAFLLYFCLSGVLSFAQTDTLPPQKSDATWQKIGACRAELLQSFLIEDPAGAGLWMDSLSRLENEFFTGLVWDERWMLHFWTESYGTLLEEVSHFDENEQARQSWKIPPPKDSLYEWLDISLNERRFDLFSSIRKAFLNEEEKAFSTLLLEYLLRLNTDEEEWAQRLQSFEDHYPSSRFLAFVHSIKPKILKPSHHALGISAGLLSGNWKGKIDRSLSTPYAFGLDAYYWSKRWNWLFDCYFGGPAITRDLLIDGEIWPENDPTSFFSVGLQWGYDVINGSKLRVFPSVGAGMSFLRPPTPGENEDPLPEYYDNFYFRELHLAAALNADVKLFQKNYRKWNTPKGSYHGIRLKFGWNGLNFDKQFEDFQGELFYFAVHYNFFGYLSSSQ